MEGFTRQLATFLPALKTADYTTLFRRDTTHGYSHPGEYNDAPRGYRRDNRQYRGLKEINHREWMCEKWKVRRGWTRSMS